MSASPPAPRQPPGAPRPPQRGEPGYDNIGGGILARGWVVQSVIAITLLMTLGMVSLIYLRWLTVQEPTATIMIAGDPSCAGAEILFNGGPSGPVAATLNKSNNFFTPVHLQPGSYHLAVKLEEQSILDIQVSVGSLRTPTIDLPTLLTVTGEPADDGADASLVAVPDGTPARQELDHQSDYSASWRIPGGTYHLTVVRNGITLYDNAALSVPAHSPITIDLSQPQHRTRD